MTYHAIRTAILPIGGVRVGFYSGRDKTRADDFPATSPQDHR